MEAALLRGKHVLVEKPLIATRSGAEDLIALARPRGLVLMENFTSLHHTQHRAVMDLLREGTIGELRSLSAAFTIPPKPEGDIRYQPDVGGGALLDIGIYPLRAALHFLGPDLHAVGAVGFALRGLETFFNHPPGSRDSREFLQRSSGRAEADVVGDFCWVREAAPCQKPVIPAGTPPGPDCGCGPVVLARAVSAVAAAQARPCVVGKLADQLVRAGLAEKFHGHDHL